MHVPNDGACQDGSFCNGTETCDPLAGDPSTGCLAGVAVACDDGIPCTVDACDDALTACVHEADSSACDDGLFCNGAETCAPGLGCQSGAAVLCDDGLSCTADACSDAAGACLHLPLHAACDDGLGCNGVEQCSPTGPGPSGCVPGASIPCGSDGIGCTVDGCDEASLTCAHAPANGLCPAGQLCAPQLGGCSAAPPCSTDAACGDGDACNGIESCVNGVCAPGTPVSCDDLVACTLDACDPLTGLCGHAPNDAACGDGLACNGVESCDPLLGCLGGAPVVCDDGVACSVELCLEPTGTCAHLPNDALCSDGVFCNGVETCTAVGCAPGTAVVCPSDGVACTSEVCDPGADACVSAPDDALCGCGQTCNPQLGCGSFCAVSTCQGKVYACGDCLDNDGDCQIDASDGMCLGPCDNTEDGFSGGIPGQNNAPCRADCYFDQDTGAGNDDCYWSHKCDPLEVAPAFAPEGPQCAYNPGANIPGYGGTCATAETSQSATCGSYCGPLTPNGCDCFGCCVIPGAPTPVWLGSESPAGTPSCTLATLGDPALCKPCTQVSACLNPCETCELCVGKPTLPPGCGETQDCGERPACGQPGQPLCPSGMSCITGCCSMSPL